MNRSRRFFGGLIFNYGYQATLMVAGLWLTPFFLRRIGQHDYGLWLVGTQLLTYLRLTDFGVVALLPQETAYATGRAGGVEKATDLPQIVGQTARLALYQLPAVVLIALAMWMAIPLEWQGLRGPLAIVLLGFVVAFPLRLLPALLQGLQDLAFVNGWQFFNWALSMVVTIWMVMAGWSLIALAVGWLVSQTVLTPVYAYRIWRRYPGVIPRRLPPFSWSASRVRLEKGFWMNVAQVAQLLMANTDLLIIGRLLGPAAVVPYSCTGKLANVLANQAQILMQTAEPGLCELKTAESRHRIFQVLVALNHGILTFSGLVFCVVLLINQWFVTWWVTAGQYGGFFLTAAILLNLLFVHWDTVAAYSVFCFGYQRRISLTNLGNGVVTAAATFGLTMVMGPLGAPLGSMAGTCLVGLPFNLWIIARDTGVSVPRLAAAMLGNWCWRFALVATPVWFMARHWSPRNLFEAAAAALGVTVLYLLMMIPNVMRSPLGNYVRPLLAGLRSRDAALQRVSS